MCYLSLGQCKNYNNFGKLANKEFNENQHDMRFYFQIIEHQLLPSKQKPRNYLYSYLLSLAWHKYLQYENILLHVYTFVLDIDNQWRLDGILLWLKNIGRGIPISLWIGDILLDYAFVIWFTFTGSFISGRSQTRKKRSVKPYLNYICKTENCL